jgi:putative DNA primase/helicase
MKYFEQFAECRVGRSDTYPLNDIGIAKLFCDLHAKEHCYVIESKAWYTFMGQLWVKDVSGLNVMERCKDFVQNLVKYADSIKGEINNGDDFVTFAKSFHVRRRRESLLHDARSVAPKRLTEFDRDTLLLNCANGTFNLKTMMLQPHNPADYITKTARVTYNEGVICERWEKFVGEVMRGDVDTAKFLQKSLGYSISGDTSLECFFILYGPSTRNGKSTMQESVAHILGDYARTAQPQTLSRRSGNGAAPSPDIARLKGARLVTVPELEKDLELNSALVKQLTGGDTFTGRFLHENPIEYKPEFKIFINTNILPRITDSTIFASDRVKIIPFERHFTPEEQDSGLKKLFQKEDNKSGILNWLIEGYRLLKSEGLAPSKKVQRAINEYRNVDDSLGIFLVDALVPVEGNRLKTSILHQQYAAWSRANGFRSMNSQVFVSELRRRYDVRRDCVKGNVIVNYDLKNKRS